MKNSTKWTVLTSFALLGLNVTAKSADSPTTNPPGQVSPREINPVRQNDATGVEPNVSDTGNSKTSPETGMVPTEGGINKSTPKGRSAGTGNINGTVETVDSANNRVSIRDASGQVHDVTLNNRTSMTVNGKRTRIGSLKAGDSVQLKTR